ncbi:NAD(P)H-binding protein [Mesorhizobium sp. WSM3862]|uniref:NAD(P)-dependent oxidoreductase n=1 Tax=Mesorhizobium sp. WSM3862 TaxID=632858 RepID=UPI000BB06F48|nr:NAD(P)H-binding protein [Mesorhizobium sp. WSM3862]PBB98280.1 epimerase [Mesorhizobium sp. WSM3862]
MQGITRVTMWGDTVFEEGAAQGLVEQCDYVYTRLLPGWGASRFRRRAQAWLTSGADWPGRPEMKLLIFGASGATGRALVSGALAEDHLVTAFVRTPRKLAISHDRLSVTVGDVADCKAVEGAIAGHDAVLSCLGVGVPLKHDAAVIAGIGFIVEAMQRSGPTRLIYQSFLGVRDSRRQLGPLLGGIVVPLVLRHEAADHEAKERLITQSGLDWTIVRPPKLGNGPATGRFRHGHGIRARSLLPTLARADVAAFMLDQVSDKTYSRTAVALLP